MMDEVLVVSIRLCHVGHWVTRMSVLIWGLFLKDLSNSGGFLE